MKPGDLNVIEGNDPVRRQAAAWFARLRADDVSEQESRNWQDWLNLDPEHRKAYERIEKLWSGLGAHASSPEIAKRLQENGPAALPSPRTHTRRRSRLAWLAGAIAIGIAAATTLVFMLPRPVAEVRYATGIGEQRTVVLEDGSRVSLDTSTALRVSYGKNERRIWLDRGRAFFRVAKERRPLAVHTEIGSVRAVGTAFEVYRRDHGVDVALLEGSVLLLPPGDASASSKPVPMQAGHRANFDPSGSAPTIASIPAASVPSWLSGRLVFNDEPLPAVLAEFNRYTRKSIVLGDETLSRMHISGVFRSDDPNGFLSALHESYALSAREDEEGRLVLSKR